MIRQFEVELTAIFLNLGLEQVLHEPTRGGNLLDLIATSHPAKCYQTGTLAPLGDSDHLITATALTIQLTRRYTPINKSEPLSVENLHSRVKRLNTEDAWATYRRHLVTNLTRRAETVYIEDLVNDVETGNTRRFFTYAKSALGKTSTGIPALQVDSGSWISVEEDQSKNAECQFSYQLTVDGEGDPKVPEASASSSQRRYRSWPRSCFQLAQLTVVTAGSPSEEKRTFQKSRDKQCPLRVKRLNRNLYPVPAVLDCRNRNLCPVPAVLDYRNRNLCPVPAVLDYRNRNLCPVPAVLVYRNRNLCPVPAVLDYRNRNLCPVPVVLDFRTRNLCPVPAVLDYRNRNLCPVPAVLDYRTRYLCPVPAVLDYRNRNLCPVPAVLDYRNRNLCPVPAVLVYRNRNLCPVPAVLDYRNRNLCPVPVVLDFRTRNLCPVPAVLDYRNRNLCPVPAVLDYRTRYLCPVPAVLDYRNRNLCPVPAALDYRNRNLCPVPAVLDYRIRNLCPVNAKDGQDIPSSSLSLGGTQAERSWYTVSSQSQTSKVEAALSMPKPKQLLEQFLEASYSKVQKVQVQCNRQVRQSVPPSRC
ncbi:hypothetical protein Bbelb_364400 [Branchiostoma belcheri]|nr:hypothetical protein Bbelb_364400 [Branchiostoma belcheri]